MLLCRDTRQRLEPVCEMGRAVFQRPGFHTVGNVIGDIQIQRLFLLQARLPRLHRARRYILGHGLLAEYHAAEQIGNSVFLFLHMRLSSSRFAQRVPCRADVSCGHLSIAAANDRRGTRIQKIWTHFTRFHFQNQRAMFYNFFQRDHPILPRSNKISHRQQKTVATEEKPRYSRIEPFIASCKSGRPVYTGLPLILLFAPRQLAPQKQQRHAGADHHR